MAKGNNNATVFPNLILVLSILLLVSMAEGKGFFGVALWTRKSTPECESAFGVREGDTCFGITRLFNMTAEFFHTINPNLNCNSLFVGQWVCVAGSAN